ncbi:thioredoxin family protein [Inhella sp. 1Y17]|uniref:Thioredoxin family protein n=2 Tax=Inhella proteolytica TaxID=2795029 RepID=A0A931JAG3_9BURK|nr:thioredoxin family protein [Inhella proteolytica]
MGAVQAQQASASVRSEQATARLLVHAPDGVGAGKTIWAGVQMQHEPGWHTYWRNPGDSGLPTRLNWTLPAGAQAGAIHWPAPHKMPLGPLMNYGFEGELLLPVALKLPAELPAGPLKLGLLAEWLVCKEVCIPERGEFSVELPQGQPLNDHAAAFKAALAAEPQPLPGVKVQARQAAEALQLEIDGLPAGWRGQGIEAFGADAGVYDHARPEQANWQGERLSLALPLSPQRGESPAELEVVLRAGEQTGSLRFALQGGWQANAPEAAAAPVQHLGGGAPASPPAQPAGGDVGLLAALALAFVGGLILNLMPCVFPVLSLKALALVREAPHERHVGAAAYTAGVVLSFVLLAALLLGLRAAGDQIGWGFQLQSPTVVAALAGLFTLIAMNLFGLFEFGNWLPSGVAGWRAQRPWLDQAATGVLSVAVASPCTAPFMGAALGAALTLPPAQALAVFAALGLGMAAPYVSFALVPGLAARLPRPGAWMERLRHLLGFPMLATVLWLVWVLGQQAGLDAAVALLVLLLALAYALWAWALRGWGWRLSAAVVLALGWLWAAPSLHQPAGAPAAAAAPAAGWSAWSPEAQQAAIASGKPLFVDFTAAWCITCQYNKRNALADAGVQADFAAAGVQRLRADWTLRDAAITAELRRLGRSGVPVYALYTPGRTEPELMAEILSVDALRARLQALQK